MKTAMGICAALFLILWFAFACVSEKDPEPVDPVPADTTAVDSEKVAINDDSTDVLLVKGKSSYAGIVAFTTKWHTYYVRELPPLKSAVFGRAEDPETDIVARINLSELLGGIITIHVMVDTTSPDSTLGAHDLRVREFVKKYRHLLTTEAPR